MHRDGRCACNRDLGRPYRSAGFPHDELGNEELTGLRMFAVEPGDQRVDRDRTDAIGWLSDGRQGHSGPRGELDVVEADDGDVVRHPYPVVEQRILEAEG